MKTQASTRFRLAIGAAAAAVRRKVPVALCVTLCTLELTVSANAHQGGTFVTFDAPGAGTGVNQGTYPVSASINPAGVITGYYYDTNSIAHGFVRATDGTITTFDPPGSVATYVHAIDSTGVITGDYYDASFADHGFVRASDGTFTTFDLPELISLAPLEASTPQGTSPEATMT